MGSMKNARLVVVLLGLVLALMLGGCGGDDEGGDAGDAPGHMEGAGETDQTGQTGQSDFVSSGMLRDSFDGGTEGLVLMRDETFAARLHEVEVAAVYDEEMAAFIGRVKNEAAVAVCDVRIGLHIDDGAATLEAPLMGLGLSAQQGHDFEVPHAGSEWTEWTVSVDTYTCASAPAAMAAMGMGEGAEGGGGEGMGEHGGGGGEGGHAEGAEGGGEGGGESGPEASPDTSIEETVGGTLQNQTFSFAFHADTQTFEGTVENTSMSLVCDSRTEIHVGTAGGGVELGPTIEQDLAPGDVLNVVMYLHPTGQAVTYSLHPEASACP